MTGDRQLRRRTAGLAVLLCSPALGCSSNKPAPAARDGAGAVDGQYCVYEMPGFHYIHVGIAFGGGASRVEAQWTPTPGPVAAVHVPTTWKPRGTTS